MKRQDHHAWTAVDDAALRAGYAIGDPAPDIAAVIGVTVSAVHNRAQTLNVPHRRKARSMAQRFWDHVSPEPNCGCWLWDGASDRKGYGQLNVGGATQYATYIALELHGRPVPRGLGALHTCDMPPCVNPDHLFHGTPKDNAADRDAKGRGSKPPPSEIGRGRRSHCQRGHELAGDNLYFSREGVRSCRACRRIHKAATNARLKAARAAIREAGQHAS